MDLSQLEFLLEPDGRLLLGEVESSYDGTNALLVGSRLRQRYPADLVAAALTQVGLRRRAVEKFDAAAAGMFFTPAGLEQATHRVVAAHRAERLASVGGAPRLVDLCCGAGADLMAAATVGLQVSGVDKDPVTAGVAAANLASRGLAGSVVVGAAEDVDLSAYDLVFADPARRGPRGRVFDPEGFSPPWSFVARAVLGAGTAGGRGGAVKTAPGIPHGLVPAGAEAEFVSLDGGLREACVWSPGLASAARRASLLRSDGGAESMSDADDPGPADVRSVGGHLYEPDDAVIRAHLVTGVAAIVDGWLLDPHVAYVSSDRRTDTPFARGFEVLEVLPYRMRALRSALRARGIGPLTVKKRGVVVAPEHLVSRLGLTGDEPGTLILSRTPDSAIAVLVRPHGQVRH